MDGNLWGVDAPTNRAIVLGGSFSPLGNPVLDRGRRVSVSAVTLGHYRITTLDSYPRILNAIAQVQTADNKSAHIQVGDITQNNNGTWSVDIFVNRPIGFIPLPLYGAREIASSDIQNLAAHGGLLAKDSTPILERINAGTDKAWRLNWASSNVNPIDWGGIPTPPDLDDSQAMTFKARAEMGGSTDTPTLSVVSSFGVGGGVTDTTGALADAIGTVQATIAAGDVSAYPAALGGVEVTPGAHTTDALYLYSAWIEYVRKQNLSHLDTDDNQRVQFSLEFSNSTKD